MKKQLTELHDLLKERWDAAGKPTGLTEVCLVKMKRLIDGTPKGSDTFRAMNDALSRFDEWFDCGEPPTPAELVVIEAARDVMQREVCSKLIKQAAKA